MKRSIAATLAGASAMLFTLTACGTSATSPEAAITASPITCPTCAPSGTVINVSITASKATADHNQVSVGLNQPVTLRITATKAGELHVHSTPEQHIEFPAGASTITLKFNLQGTVVIEDHALDQQITQVQVN